jgi:hypothetical protein
MPTFLQHPAFRVSALSSLARTRRSRDPFPLGASAPLRPGGKTQLGLGLFGLALIFASACVPPGDGVPPPMNRVYFPVALEVTESGSHLIVVGSDFDLQFNQGTVHSLDLTRVRALLPRVCSADSDCSSGQLCDREPSDENRERPSFFCVDASGKNKGQPCPEKGLKPWSLLATSPGACAPWPLESSGDLENSLIADVVQTSAFATDATLLSRPADAPKGPGERLFVPVRGDSSLHWFDIVDGKFECGQAEERGICSSDYAARRNPSILLSLDPRRELEVPPEPYEVAASPDGRVLAVTHQTTGIVSAFSHNWSEGPKVVALARGLPGNPLGIAGLPPRAAIVPGEQTSPGFLASFKDRAEMHVLRFIDEAPVTDSGEATMVGPQLVDAARVSVTLNASGVASRGVVIDSRRREAAQAKCAPSDQDCLREAERVPLDIYVANRSPNSLLLGKTTHVTDSGDASDVPAFYGNVPLTQGPSGVFLGEIVNSEGQVEPRVFVTCFDSSVVYVIDPERRRIESEFVTGRGPQSVAFEVLSDPDAKPRALMYVAQFTDSYVAVMSLDQRYPETYGATLATLGTPTQPRAAK